MNSDLDISEFSGASREGKRRLKQAFARILQNELLEHNWTQSDLANRSGLGRDAISTYVNARSFPEPRSLKAIATALGKEIKDIYPTVSTDPAKGHAISIRQDPDDPMRVFLTVNRSIPITLAGQIVEMVKPEVA
ncbi:helix-turn-helix transcriptional regulator [Thalassobaculum sp. OXR-137]|uniref:helix-turn-helix domain-containing protein n=1 Tax=Thalassobaculum sp. OXR-137 TaxID=3100173 RepID=UPI002AC9BBD8|nr:helix-turn-helix transcriptional regulator [Thalassobaculum sp. OXR-137]WPZ36751.1 helix-turn-helix transcriptional regulator [Thalassobaculum sp. OXR-137]